MKHGILSAAITLVAAPLAHADELLVPSQFPTIGAALSAAAPGDAITVAPGDYQINLTVNKAVTIRAADGPSVTTLRPVNSFQPIVRYSGVPGPSRLEGFTLTGGSALFAIGSAVEVVDTSGLVLENLIVRDNTNGGNGGGVGIANSAVTITGCAFRDNTVSIVSSGFGSGGVYSFNAETQIIGSTFERNRFLDSSGGAVTMRGSPPDRSAGAFPAPNSIVGCTFIDNSAEGGIGGAVHLTEGVSVDIVDSTFSGNSSPGGGGGGVGTDGGVVRISGCVFEQNICDGGGGAGVYATGSFFDAPPAVTVDRCVFTENLTPGGTGGGVRSENGATVAVSNSVIAGNIAEGGSGPAASVNRASLSLINTTITGNSGGSAVIAETLFSSPSALIIANSIIRGNGGSDVAISGGVAATIAYSNVESVLGMFTGTGVIDAPVTFTDPTSGDYSLTPGSPGIDGGDNTAVPPGATLDLPGGARFADDPAAADTGVGPAPIVDMGAYEFQPPSCPADVNGDGQLTPADFSAWVAAFNAQAPGCDQNGDSMCTPGDFSAWIANFNAGC